MSIASAITAAQGKVAAAYTKCNAKGATMPVTQDLSNLADCIDSITTGGGTTPVEKKWLTFYDYDGTILFSYTKAEALLLQALPTYNQTHTIADGATTLTFVKWNHTLAQILAEIANRPINVGATVKPTDGKTHFDMIVPYDGTTFQCTVYEMNLGGSTVTIDWGDGTSPSTGSQPLEHTYTSAGHYWVTMSSPGSSISMSGLGMKITNIGSNNNSVIASVREMYLAENFHRNRRSLNGFAGLEIFTIVTGLSDYYTFTECSNLKWVTIPAEGLNFDSIGSASTFSGCYAMKAYSIPPAVTLLAFNSFEYNAGIEELSFPNGITFNGSGNATFNGKKLRKIYNLPNWSSGQYVFGNATALVEITFSSTCVIIGSGMFSGGSGLRYVDIPATVTELKGYVFNQCINLVQVIMRATTPPTVSSTTFNSTNADLKIYVPYSADHSVLAAYKGASNWLNYASQIYELDSNGNIPSA